MLKHDTGVLAATTAFGKTVIAAWLIAERGVNTLVLVHRRQLLDQWVERLAAFLDLPAKSIGRIGGGRSKATGGLDVAVIQSLVHKGVVDDRVADYATRPPEIAESLATLHALIRFGTEGGQRFKSSRPTNSSIILRTSTAYTPLSSAAVRHVRSFIYNHCTREQALDGRRGAGSGTGSSCRAPGRRPARIV